MSEADNVVKIKIVYFFLKLQYCLHYFYKEIKPINRLLSKRDKKNFQFRIREWKK